MSWVLENTSISIVDMLETVVAETEVKNTSKSLGLNRAVTTRKMPFSDEEFLTDPKSPLKKSYFRWQNKALANTW